MTITQVHSDAAPKAIGPYSQAVVAGGFVFASGQIPLDPNTGEMVKGDIAAQTRRVLANLEAVLAAAGTSLEKVVKATVFLTDLSHFGTVNAIYEEALGGARPARSTVQVAALPRGAEVEIEVVAVA
ncbi:MAG TPA: RidA family protein [Thermodesulfobacteriota bacterium]